MKGLLGSIPLSVSVMSEKLRVVQLIGGIGH
jgi:hypothetical protein